MLPRAPRIRLYEVATVKEPLRPIGPILAVGILIGVSACAAAPPSDSVPTVWMLLRHMLSLAKLTKPPL